MLEKQSTLLETSQRATVHLSGATSLATSASRCWPGRNSTPRRRRRRRLGACAKPRIIPSRHGEAAAKPHSQPHRISAACPIRYTRSLAARSTAWVCVCVCACVLVLIQALLQMRPPTAHGRRGARAGSLHISITMTRLSSICFWILSSRM